MRKKITDKNRMSGCRNAEMKISIARFQRKLIFDLGMKVSVKLNCSNMMFMIERNAAAYNGVVKSNHETMLGLMSKAAKRGPKAKPRQPAKIISAMYLALLLGVLKSINAAWATGCEPAVKPAIMRPRRSMIML